MAAGAAGASARWAPKPSSRLVVAAAGVAIAGEGHAESLDAPQPPPEGDRIEREAAEDDRVCRGDKAGIGHWVTSAVCTRSRWPRRAISSRAASASASW